MAKVPGADCIAVVQSGRTNEQIREGDHFPDSSRIGVHFSRDLRHLSAEALDRNRGENSVEIVPSLLCLLRCLRPMKPVFQLDHRDRREHNLVFAVLVFYILTIVGLFVLRVKRPDEPRPYRAIGYPVLPAMYIVIAAFIDIVLLRYKPQYTWPGLFIVLLGIPVYFLWSRFNSQARTQA